MHRLLVLFSLPMLLSAAELTIDHVSIGEAGLKTAREHLASIGIPSEYGGPHSNHATEMALASFPDGSYLELISVQPHADAKALAAHYWSKQITGNAGPTAWAVRAKNIDGEINRLRDAGVNISDATHSGRTRPDGVKLEWESAPVGSEPNGTFFPFLIHDIGDRSARAFPGGKPTNANFSGIRNVVIVVRDLPAAIARYRKAYGLPAPQQQTDATFGAHLAAFTGTPVILAAPADSKSWLNERLQRYGEGPCAFVLGGYQGSQQKESAHWFGAEIFWFDAAKLGWRLAYEKN